MITALIIFIFITTYISIGLRRIPRTHIDRPAGALVGAILMIAFGVITLDEAFAAIDMHTLLLSKSDAPAVSAISDTRKIISISSAGDPTQSRTYRVVLLCDTMESRARGLQGFRALQPGEAALFVFDNPEAVTFWMGSVAFPIDIIFVSGDGSVMTVYPHCRPGSRDFCRSGQAVKWVVETAAGSGVKAGDRVKIE